MRFAHKYVLFTIALLSLWLGGCNKYRPSGAVPTPEPTVTPITGRDGVVPTTPGTVDPLDPTGGVWSSGGSAFFTPVSDDAFNRWMGGNPLTPQNMMINISLTKVTNKSIYSGSVKLRYQHNGLTYEATLSSSSSSYNGQDFSAYNRWFTYGGKTVFSGFMEDKIGAIVLVVDDTLDLGDGGGATQLSGEVWFKNFASNWAGYDAGASWSVVMPCWYRSIGPYDCRSSAVINKTSLYPTDTYQKLGTFTGMNKLKAFID